MLDVVKAYEGNPEFLQNTSPFFYAALSNPAGQAFLVKAGEDPGMARLLQGELKKIKEAKEGLKGKFATGDLELPTTPIETKIEKGFNIGLEKLDTRLNNLNQKLEKGNINKTELGNNYVNTIEAKEKLAREKLSRRYNSLAKTKGVNIRKGEITRLIKGYEPEDQASMFNSLAPSMRKIIQGLSNRQNLDAEGVLELKNAIREAQRNIKNTQQKGEIEELAERFETMRQVLPQKFNRKLREIDQQFKSDVAVKFIEDKIIDGAKTSDFSSDVYKIFLSKPEAFESITNAIGTQKGTELAKKAILADVYDKAWDANKGQTNPATIKKYLFKNRELVNKFPTVKKELEDIANGVTTVLEKRAELDNAAKQYNQKFANGYFSAVQGGNANIEKVANNMLGSQSKFYTDKIISELNERLPGDVAGQNAVKYALREQFMQNAVNNPGGVYDFIKNKEEAFTAVFGTKQYEEMKKLGQFFDKSNQIEKILNRTKGVKVETDPFEQATGVSFTYVLSQYRDRISSVPQKVARIGSKSFQARSAQNTAQAITDMLTDPESIKKMNDILAKQIDNKMPIDSFVKESWKIFAKHWTNSIRQGSVEAARLVPAAITR